MGIPSYFNHIVKNHRKIFKKLEHYAKINNLYLDSNSIIYDAMRSINNSQIRNKEEFEFILMDNVCKKIKEYIEEVNPDKVIIAFDGIAPVAKLEQQRQRRYKSHFIRNIEDEIQRTYEKEVNTMEGKTVDENEKKNAPDFKWDQTAITPGTDFMYNLDNFVKDYFKFPHKFNCEQIIVNGSTEFGEGEHKIFDHIRENPMYHKNTYTLVYGLDADLIMLCLNHQHISKNIHLFREKPDFNTDLDRYYDDNELCILDIKELSNIIVNEMTGNKSSKYQKQKIFDYIFISFMLGNDFLPHFPSLNIRTNGIDIILNTYKRIFNENQFIYDGKKIIWNRFHTFIQELSKHEHEFLLEEHKIIEKMKKYTPKCKNELDKRLTKFRMLPIKNRNIEDLIGPSQKGWEFRYYKYLFDLRINNEYRRKICNNYLEGLEWTMKYYTSGCVNYRWHYLYEYPPLLCDLVKYVPHFDTTFVSECKTSISAITQLSYVLPGNSLYLLPTKIKDALLRRYPRYYSKQHTFTWAYCKFFWESHANLPHRDINEMEELVQQCG